MQWDNVWDGVEESLSELDNAEKLKLAAEIINECDPNVSDLDGFFAQLDDSAHDELKSAADRSEWRIDS